ncbi:glycosyltransferase involved in cell wall biosynthesis [Saccharothrix tamanrassetensis]|uniref:Glycosyltransferase involved in cell wall biosynthesis n=1 Tax=Saccharothrix tamanrassetensis TaxID=1051531 RepID=A0A841CP81_9PSEU|nr:glycosyltransferase [Saccharothrix tamanrassetensis]MBB5960252.1 glycosyltransferase involved in cell wall biosynthesis [Saccharothrix tamanrassetensis]
MRIAMVSEHASPLAALGGVDAGGQNVHVADLSAALVRLRHEVTVYTRRDDPDLPERVRTGQGYDVVHVPAGPAESVPKDELLPYMGDFAQYLRERWRTEAPDVVHGHFWMSGLASVLAARNLNVPVVQTFHALGVVKRRYQGSADTSPPERVTTERLIGREVDRVAATCGDEVFELIRMGVPRSRISVVPCGVDPRLFRPDGGKDRPRLSHRLVAVGRLVPRKGFVDVITALRSLPDTELVVAGGAADVKSDPEARRLLDHARAMGVLERVRLAGQVSRRAMPALLRSADVVVCVPWYEPFGIVPLEAMACGVPVVASAVGGLTDTVVDGVTGSLVPPRDPIALARSLRSLLADPGRREAYGLAGTDRVQARYTWDRIAEDTERTYLKAGVKPTSAVAVGGGL